MTTYYVDPAASGDNDGTSWTDAWATLQSAADTATAGDVVYCRGTQSISARIDFDTNSGTYDGGYIKFVGCNSGGTVDGTQFVLDGGNNNIDGIYLNGRSYIWLENFKITQCDGTGAINSASVNSNHWVLNNVWLHDNDAWGFYNALYVPGVQLYRCLFSSNTLGGVYRPSTTTMTLFAFCEFIGNGVQDAYLVSSQVVFFWCLFRNNGNEGIYAYGGALCLNCVFDGNTNDAVDFSYDAAAQCVALVGCRVTNQSGGGAVGLLVSANTRATLFGSYFGNNTTDVTASRYDSVLVNGVDLLTLGGTDTDHGYVNSAGGDFNLDADTATGYSIAVPLD